MSSTSLCWCRAVKVQLSKYEFYTGLQNVLPYVCWTDCNYGMEPMLTVYTVVYDDIRCWELSLVLAMFLVLGLILSYTPNRHFLSEPMSVL